MASRSDVAVYIVLCSLAMLDRKELKSLVIDRPNIGQLLESDAQIQRLLETFYACEYKECLALLDRFRPRFLLDMRLSSHFDTLYHRVVQRALRQFVQPFDTLNISRISSALGWQDTLGDAHVVQELLILIKDGLIDARVDLAHNVCLIVKQTINTLTSPL